MLPEMPIQPVKRYQSKTAEIEMRIVGKQLVVKAGSYCNLYLIKTSVFQEQRRLITMY
jgi:hypothetical protein